MDIGNSYANELALGSYRQSGSVVPAGTAAMLRLAIPFGSDASRQTRPTLSLSAGTTWQTEFGPQDFVVRYMPAIEAGLAFDRDPVLRLGSIDLLTGLAARWSAAAGAESTEDTGVPNWVWWVGGAVVVLGIAVLVVRSSSCHGVQHTICGPLLGVPGPG